jgi:hypothetical protein
MDWVEILKDQDFAELVELNDSEDNQRRREVAIITDLYEDYFNGVPTEEG